MLDFTNSFERLQVGARNTDSEVMAVRQKRLSVFSKVRWVALDKEKFESLLNDISYFIAKLNELVPPIAHSYQGGVLANFRQDSLPLIPALAQEQSVVVAGKSGLEQFHTRLLNRLWFRKIAERREYIHPAHSATLKWVFTPPSPDQGWTDLSHWLRSGSGIYWISGKAGSGKSTLMKYLVDHVTTKSLLATWAAGVELVTPHFFFYYLGTREQKSLTGLTRTLLYDILSHNKSWIPELLPGMWKETLAASDDQSIDLPTHSEVISAFLALGQLPVKLCVFVDGLDEYDCDNLEVISFIQSLARSPNIKLVVSSRPEPEFIESFSGHPMLRMQEATQDDITLYVRDKLGSHRYMTALLERPDTRLRALGLMDTLCEKADGVFIWVVLASMSLERGFVNKDRIQELERRIAELPRELTDMFVHMMGRVSKGYQQQGAKYLRICFDSVQNERPGYLRLAGFALVDRNHQNHAACSLVDENMMEGLGNLCEDFAGRLNSRCGGLLEITSREEFLISEVVFFHRTVVEFLQTEGAWDLDLLQIRDASFNSHLALSSIWMYTAQLPFLTSGWCIGVALKWLSDALTMGQQPVDTVISFILTWQDVLLHAESEQVFRNITSANTTNRGKERVPVPDEIGLVIVIELGIVEIFDFYAQRHGLTEHLHRRRGRYPLVYHALYRPFVNSFVKAFGSEPLPVDQWRIVQVIKHLLISGCNSMEPFISEEGRDGPTTVWNACTRYIETESPKTDSQSDWAHQLVELFLQLSNDKQALIEKTRTASNRARFLKMLRAALVDRCMGEGLRSRGLVILCKLFGEEYIASQPGYSTTMVSRASAYETENDLDERRMPPPKRRRV